MKIITSGLTRDTEKEFGKIGDRGSFAIFYNKAIYRFCYSLESKNDVARFLKDFQSMKFENCDYEETDGGENKSIEFFHEDDEETQLPSRSPPRGPSRGGPPGGPSRGGPPGGPSRGGPPGGPSRGGPPGGPSRGGPPKGPSRSPPSSRPSGPSGGPSRGPPRGPSRGPPSGGPKGGPPKGPKRGPPK